MMRFDELCPFCKTVNYNLYLEETKGLYVCEQCGRLIDAKDDLKAITIAYPANHNSEPALAGMSH